MSSTQPSTPSKARQPAKMETDRDNFPFGRAGVELLERSAALILSLVQRVNYPDSLDLHSRPAIQSDPLASHNRFEHVQARIPIPYHDSPGSSIIGETPRFAIP